MMKKEKPRILLIKPTEDPEHGARMMAQLEKENRLFPEAEVIPNARNTSFRELAENVFPDRDGAYSNPIYLFKSRHPTTIGIAALARKTMEFLEGQKGEHPMDILSVSAGIDGDRLMTMALVRVYGKKPRFAALSDYLGEKEKSDTGGRTEVRRLIPRGSYRRIEKDEKERHELALAEQQKYLDAADENAPFLNSIGHYEPMMIHEVDDRVERIYDLRTKDMQIQLNTSYEEFTGVFSDCMEYITSTERDTYYSVLKGQTEKKDLYDVINAYIERAFLETGRLPMEDLAALLKKVEIALFELYVVQDLIDDELITDIWVTGPDTVRVRVEGEAYLSNITFIDENDYLRFVKGIAVRNGINIQEPVQTFVDDYDENYKLRFEMSSPYITDSGLPNIHIRKFRKKKLMAEDLISAGMMDEKIQRYLMDRGRYGKGIIFAGPPGSGKSTMLNWALEDLYESAATMLVIQESPELFAYRKGVMFQHVVLNPQRGEPPVTLEKLGQMALVSGANVFVIGEVKGAEICSAITLSNSGCRTAMTLHCQSSTEAVDKMVDLARRGMPNATLEQAKRMIKSFDTIVYLEGFRVREITEIIGYDEEKKDMIYRPIYRRR